MKVKFQIENSVQLIDDIEVKTATIQLNAVPDAGLDK